MYRQGSPFVYWEENSRIHKLCSFYKILSLVIIFLCLIFADSFIDMGICLFYIFVVIIFSDVSVRVVLNSLMMFKFIIFLLFFLFSFSYLNLLIGFSIALKFILFILYLSVISMCTSFYEVVDGMRKFVKPLSIFFDTKELVLNAACLIKFFSIMYSENDRIRASKRLRGVRFNDMNVIDRMDSFINNLGPLYREVIGKLRKLKRGMVVKKYGISDVRYNYRLNKWGKTDTILLVINVMIMIIVAVY
jgi:energy-coupling factor transporter transmembrane protein EcfT